MPFEARNIVNVRVLFCACWLWVQVTKLYERLCYGTVVGCISHRLLTLRLSLVNCCSIFCYLMIQLYSLFFIIHSLLYAYNDLCLFLCCWLITSHKSTPDLGINPSRVTVKFQRATLGIPSRHPSFPFLGDLRDLRVQSKRWSCHKFFISYDLEYLGFLVYTAYLWHLV